MTAHDDPIAYVLDRLWSHCTAEGRHNAVAEMVSLCAANDFAHALMLAIAIELDRAKREEHAESFDDFGKPFVLDELAKRTLFGFLLRHRNDWRELRGTRPIVPHCTTIKDVDRILRAAKRTYPPPPPFANGVHPTPPTPA